jgi:hypothetical protein
MNKSPASARFADGTGMPKGGTFPHVRSSPEDTHFFHTMVLLMPSRLIKFSSDYCCKIVAQ